MLHPKICEKIKLLDKIILSKLRGAGSYGEVFVYKIENTEIAVKCFHSQKDAQSEINNIKII